MATRAVIYWFSGTGNSLTLARKLAERLDDCELVPIAAVAADTERACPDAERVGFVFPVYAFGAPRIVTETAARLPLDSATYVFSVANAAKVAGAPHAELAAYLEKRNVELQAGWTLLMPTNYLPFGEAPPPAKQQALFAKADARLTEIADNVRTGTPHRREDSVPPLSWIAKFIHPHARSAFAKDDRKFSTTDACTQCGLCAKVCPVGNIELHDGKPVWQHHCEQCVACLNWCPTSAIQLGSRTQGKKRYHHPDVNAKDLILER